MGKSRRVIVMPGKVEEAAPNKIWLRREFGKEQVNYMIESSLFKKIYDEIGSSLLPYFEGILSKLRKLA